MDALSQIQKRLLDKYDPALDKVGLSGLLDDIIAEVAALQGTGGVTSAMIAADAVTTAKILDLNVTTGKLAAGAVTAAKLADGAGVAALLTSGLGASAAYTKATNGPQTLMADDVAARVVLGMAIVTETFADNTGTQPAAVSVGEEDTPTKYLGNAVFVDAVAGSIFFFAGTLTATKELRVLQTAAVGDATGAISVTALVLPAA